MPQGLGGKVALITGAAQGIGLGIAKRLAQGGVHLALVDRSGEKLAQAQQQLSEYSVQVTHYVADVTDLSQVQQAIEHAETTLGGFDIMINNAGIAQVQAIQDVTPEEFRQIVDVNIGGVLWGIQAAAKKFMQRGHKGKIINAASIAGHEGFAMLGVYSATKFAVRALTQAAAKEYAAYGINVNAYCPGVVGTDMWVEIDRRFAALSGAEIGETYQKYVAGIALGRAETPADVAGFVAFLASDDANYMTGQSVMIDGGMIYR